MRILVCFGGHDSSSPTGAISHLTSILTHKITLFLLLLNSPGRFVHRLGAFSVLTHIFDANFWASNRVGPTLSKAARHSFCNEILGMYVDLGLIELFTRVLGH